MPRSGDDIKNVGYTIQSADCLGSNLSPLAYHCASHIILRDLTILKTEQFLGVCQSGARAFKEHMAA